MCINFAPYLHQKSVNGDEYGDILGALVLMFLLNSSKIVLLEDAVPALICFIMILDLHHCKKMCK